MTYIDGRVRGPSGERDVRFLVDSGATYTLLPNDVWRAVGLERERTQRFGLADGTLIERGMSSCRLTLPQGESYTTVILGEPGDETPLLGITTLENLGLMLNPLSRELIPMVLRL